MKNKLAIPQQGAVKIGRDTFPVASIKEASECWIAARKAYNWASSEAPRCEGILNGRKFKISYNGRVWDKITGIEIPTT